MVKTSLEKFDSPVVMINQEYDNEDWSLITSYVSQQDAKNLETDSALEIIGWHLSVVLPSMDEKEFDQVFSTPETALEFGIDKILSGSLTVAKSPATDLNGDPHPFGRYQSIV